MVRTLTQKKRRIRISGTCKPPKKFKRVAISYAYKFRLWSEPNWELLRRLLEEVPVVRHAVDTRHDIENFVAPEEELDN
ncbi:uncharacterized protein PITG_17366 [Phytophthora infestans T30-4]|uniref:Uncharacterized protein n=1 Tax=Phytophthora infestans (strain T30-4) TaxID=403677 RepID=D0NVW9_PHYIT|nr:uncharacterized protein PITG_17366 [Phytophthora infestans T30-4]EEY66800.1 hypothetical protein PITG_17366 [Phytophthora infestans T30-4]|eukprot:XP_002896865.1 hypothetical protein PITG_17366 [Phytophthora infestans T30-4]